MIVVGLSAAASLLVGAAVPAPAALPCVPVPTVLDRCPAWVASYHHPEGHNGVGQQESRAIIASPAGDRVYITGAIYDDEAASDFGTIAYDASTGATIWLERHDGPSHQGDGATAIALSPAADVVYVTGVETIARGTETVGDFATVAYDAATGTRRWVARFAGPAGGDDRARGIAVSPDGRRVYVAGISDSAGGDRDTALLAYDAATGEEVWAIRFAGPSGHDDTLTRIAIAPDGSQIYLAGEQDSDPSQDPPALSRYAVSAYAAKDGEELWRAAYDGGLPGRNIAKGIVADEVSVFVTGESYGPDGGYDFATASFAATDGELRWSRRYSGDAAASDDARAIALNPAGDRLFVAGRATVVEEELPQGIRQTGSDFAVLAYDPASGSLLWESGYGLPQQRWELPTAMTTSPDGSRVYVTGMGAREYAPENVNNQCANCPSAFITVAFDASNGARAWAGRFRPTAEELDAGVPSGIAAAGGRVFITGTFGGFTYACTVALTCAGQDLENFSDYWTLAYEG